MTIENKSSTDPNPLSVNGAQLDGKRHLSAGDLIEVRYTELPPSVALPQQLSVAPKPVSETSRRGCNLQLLASSLISSCHHARHTISCMLFCCGDC